MNMRSRWSFCSYILANHNVKAKFVLIGIWNSVFGYSIFVGLDTLFVGVFSQRYVAYMLAMILSNLFAIVNAYILHKYVTFKSEVRGRGKRWSFKILLSPLTARATVC